MTNSHRQRTTIEVERESASEERWLSCHYASLSLHLFANPEHFSRFESRSLSHLRLSPKLPHGVQNCTGKTTDSNDSILTARRQTQRVTSRYITPSLRRIRPRI